MGRFIQDAPYLVALDFDGTIKSGKDYDQNWEAWELTPGFLDFVSWTKTQNIKLVLWTCRNLDSPHDFEPVYSFLERENLVEDIVVHFKPGAPYTYAGKINYFWGTGSLKQYADFYVDDLAVGCPLLSTGTPDWEKIKELINGALGSNL